MPKWHIWGHPALGPGRKEGRKGGREGGREGRKEAGRKASQLNHIVCLGTWFGFGVMR